MNIWEFIHSSLDKDFKLVLMLVVDSNGSSPGRQGFKMAINSQGKMYGSIGGGFMEHNLIDQCREMMKTPFSPFIKQQVHRKQAPKDQSGLNCSGEQGVAFYYIDLSQKELFEQLVNNNPNQLIATEKGLDISDQKVNVNFSYIQEDIQWRFTENLKFQNRLFVVGGGHVSLAFSKLMRELGFHITVIDNRGDLNTLEDNIYAHEKIICDYESIECYIPEGDNIFVTVMSFGYTTDEIALKRLIGRNYRYLGSMGSKAKIRKLQNNLKREGFFEKDVEKIHAPIGIPINSKTPFEIAISIAGEIIKVKNE